jgi:hypothetical protein
MKTLSQDTLFPGLSLKPGPANVMQAGFIFTALDMVTEAKL